MKVNVLKITQFRKWQEQQCSGVGLVSILSLSLSLSLTHTHTHTHTHTASPRLPPCSVYSALYDRWSLPVWGGHPAPTQKSNINPTSTKVGS